jgi:hypothetical protein
MTLKRVRRYALLVAVALWTVFAVDYATLGPLDRLGKIKGTDFVQFYASGSLVLAGRSDRLYDFDTLEAAIRDAVPVARETIYVPMQSPQLLFALTPFSALPYTTAVTIWMLVIAGLHAAACLMFWARSTHLHGHRREVVCCAVAFPGMYATVIHGQPSVFAPLALAFAFGALERDRRFAAGFAAGCLVFKPHWVIAAGVVFLAAREWRVIAGLCASALLQLAVALFVAGPRLFFAYLTTLGSIGRLGDVLEPRPGYALRSLFSVLAPNPIVAFACYGLAALFVAAIAARIWRSDTGFDLRASALLLAIVLINPHVFEYDLIVLMPVFFYLANGIAGGSAAGLSGRAWSWVIAALFVAPVLTAVPPIVRLQFSATAMTAILVQIWMTERSGRPAEASRSVRTLHTDAALG